MILPMKKVTVFALRRDREAILLALQRGGRMMITENDGSVRDAALPQAEESVRTAGEALSYMKKYGPKKGLLDETPRASFDELIAEKTDAQSLCDAVRGISEESAQLQNDVGTLRAAAEQLTPWLPLSIPLNALEDTRTTRVRTGYIPAAKSEALQSGMEEIGAYCELFAPASGSLAILAVCHKSDDEQVVTLLKSLGFIESAPPASDKTARQTLDDVNAEIKEKLDRLAALQDSAREKGAETRSLELLYDKLGADLRRKQTPYNETDATFYLTGWVEAAEVETVEQSLHDATDAFEFVAEAPPADEQPPTLTKNNKFVTPFETLTDMFSRPNPRDGIDPNPAMAPWYWIIFGMMMADAGYGLVMALLIGAYLLIKKPQGESSKLIRVLFYASITTAFWGVMFGSYFGAEWFPPVLFLPLYDPLPMMLLCFIIGALHIFCGIAINAVEKFKQGDPRAAVFDNLCWITLLTGLGLLALPATAAVGKWLALGSAAAIALMAKRGTKNPIARLGGGLLALYNITGYASDILSYSRILALMLSSGVVAMVMNMLAGMVQGSGGPWYVMALRFIPALAIYIAGHVFNLAMGLLSAYVHASRLQYIEFYGKFYEGGGYKFVPLSADSKYTAVYDN
ncbi:MAG: V-type ATP synthase subunit I [Oscillospiraceae bacterium]|nr:V-type ATP synthase subunit I [Oscillospiraceae bacterium]